MSISINSFRAMAGTGGQVVELSQKQPGTLKSTGFWGRLFGSRAGQDAVKNQAVMDEFCKSIRTAAGAKGERIALRTLGDAKAEGRPLKAFMIRQVFAAIDNNKAAVQQHNAFSLNTARIRTEAFLTKDLDWIRTGDPNPKLPLSESRNPQNQRLWKEVDRLLVKTANDATAMSKPLPSDTIEQSVRNRVVNRATPAFMAALNAFCNADRNGVSSATMKSLRPIILMSGVQQNAMGAAIDLAAALKDTLGTMSKVRDGADMAAFLRGIGNEQSRIFAEAGLGEDVDVNGVFNCAVQCALELSGTKPGKAAGIAEKFFTSSSVGDLMAALNRGVADGSAAATALRGTFTGLLSGFSWRSPVDVVKMAEVPLNASAETLNPRVAAYLVGEGVLTDRATEGELDNHGFGMLLSPQHKLSGEKMLRLFDASGSKGLPNVARELNRSHIRYGRLAMNVHYNALTPNRGGEKAVSPGKIWKAVFNKSIPSGVDRDNLAAHIGETLERQATEAIRKENPGWDENEVDVVLFSIMGGMNYGLDPYRALEARTRGAGNLELSRNDFPSFETLPPPKWSPDEAIRNGMEMMGIDLPRRGKNTGIDSTITVGDRDPVLLRDTDNPLLTDPAEIADYGRGRVNNTVARTIAQSVTELLGDRPETRMQRAAVLSLFSQKSMGTASYLGMALGLAVSEHSPANMTVELAGDGVARLTIQSPPRDGVDFRIVYDIDQDGSARTTDVRVADFRAEPA